MAFTPIPVEEGFTPIPVDDFASGQDSFVPQPVEPEARAGFVPQPIGEQPQEPTTDSRLEQIADIPQNIWQGAKEAYHGMAIGTDLIDIHISNSLMNFSQDKMQALEQSGDTESFKYGAYKYLNNLARNVLEKERGFVSEAEAARQAVVESGEDLAKGMISDTFKGVGGMADLLVPGLFILSGPTRMFDEGFQDSMRSGKTEKEAMDTAVAYSLMGGTLEVAADALILRGKGRVAKRTLAPILKATAKKMGFNFLSEGTTETLQDGILNKLNGRKMFSQESFRTFIVSGFVGAIAGGTQAGISEAKTSMQIKRIQNTGLSKEEATTVFEMIQDGDLEGATQMMEKGNINLRDTATEIIEMDDEQHPLNEKQAKRLDALAQKETLTAQEQVELSGLMAGLTEQEQDVVWNAVESKEYGDEFTGLMDRLNRRETIEQQRERAVKEMEQVSIPKTGTPITIDALHGTGPDGIIGGSFNKEYQGKNTGSPSAKKAFFFSNSPELAEYYQRSAGMQKSYESAVSAQEQWQRHHSKLVQNYKNVAIDMVQNSDWVKQNPDMADFAIKMIDNAADTAFIDGIVGKENASKLDVLRAKIKQSMNDPAAFKPTQMIYTAAQGSIQDIENVFPAEGRTINAELNFQNPLVIDHEGARKGRSFSKIIDEAIAKGHDSIIIRNTVDPKPADVYIALTADQINIKETQDATQERDVAQPEKVTEEAGARRDGEARREEALDTAGISKRAVNAWNEQWNRDDMPEHETRAHKALLNNAKKEDRAKADAIINEIEKKPRGLDDDEVALLVLKSADIANQVDSLEIQSEKAREAGNDELADRLDAQIDAVLEEADRINKAIAPAKTRMGQGLAALGMMVNKRSYELVDVLREARRLAKRDLTKTEKDKLRKITSEIKDLKKQISSSGKTLEERIAEVRQEIENAERFIRKKRGAPSRDRELSELQSIKRDQDVIFELLRVLRDNDIQLNEETAVNDPEGYKQTIKNLRTEISGKLRELKAYKDKANRQRVASLESLLAELNAQEKGKYRNVKKQPMVFPEDVSAIKNQIALVRERMRLDDEMASVQEDLRLIREGRLSELSRAKKRQRRTKRFNELESKRTELTLAKRRLQGELDKIDANKKYLLKTAEFMRGVQLALDSFLFRQGGKLLYSNPKMTLEAWGQSLRAYASEEQFWRLDRITKSDPDYRRAQSHGIEFNDLEGDFDVHQEAINSRLAEKIPGVKASNRSMAMGTNLMRLKWMKKVYRKFPGESDAFYRSMADFGNAVTGRGTLGSLEKSARGLTAFFTAPRWTTSNFQYLAAEARALKSGSGKAAAEIAKQKTKFATGFGMIASMMLAAGWEVDLDPEEGDFLKFRKGDLVLDLIPGLSQTMRVFALMGESFFANIGMGELEKSNTDFSKHIASFMEYKEAPIVATAFKLIEGEDAIGREVTIPEVAAMSSMPIMLQTLYDDAIKESADVEDVLVSQTAQWFGIGTGIYEDR